MIVDSESLFSAFKNTLCASDGIWSRTWLSHFKRRPLVKDGKVKTGDEREYSVGLCDHYAQQPSPSPLARTARSLA